MFCEKYFFLYNCKLRLHSTCTERQWKSDFKGVEGRREACVRAKPVRRVRFARYFATCDIGLDSVSYPGPGRAGPSRETDRLPKLQLASPMTIHIREKGRNKSVFLQQSKASNWNFWMASRPLHVFFFSKLVWMLLSHDPELWPSYKKQL